jgi:hypothetical protein
MVICVSQCSLFFTFPAVCQGSCDFLMDLIGGANGKDILYVGDHVYADIETPKKLHGWKTMQIVQELIPELETWSCNKHLFNRLCHLQAIIADVYRNDMNASSLQPKIRKLKDSMRVRVCTLCRLQNLLTPVNAVRFQL